MVRCLGFNKWLREILPKIVFLTYDFFVKPITSYKITPWGLWRIAAWCLFFLWLMGYFMPAKQIYLDTIPHANYLKNTPLVPISLVKSDPRGFRIDSLDLPDEHFSIAWIGGSSLIKLNYTQGKLFVPLEVVEQLDSINGRKVVGLVYLIFALRIYEQYLSLLHALEQSPDLVVLTINPFWIFNHHAVSVWNNLYSGVVPALGSNIKGWRSLVIFASPSQISWGLMAPHLPILQNRWDYNHQLVNWLQSYPFIKKAPNTVQHQEGWADIVKSLSQPLKFWYLYGFMDGKSPEHLAWQKMALLNANTSGTTINDKVLEWMLEALHRSGIPALIYLAPVSPQVLSDPAMAEKLSAIEGRLQFYANIYADSSMKFLAKNPSRFLKLDKSHFRDFLHLYQSAPLSNYLTQEIRSQISPKNQISIPPL